MKPFLTTVTLLMSDLAASLVFVIVFLATHDPLLSACVGMLIGFGQITVQLVRKTPVDSMQWLSLGLVLVSGAATMLTADPRFVLFKPSVIYLIIGVAMLKPGWMNRYLPPIVKAVAADIGLLTGYAWAGLMFASAALNAYLAVSTNVATWALTMASFAIASKVVLFLAGFGAIRLVTRARVRAMPADHRDALLISTGWNSASLPPALH